MNESIPIDEVVNMALNDLDLPDISLSMDKMYPWAFWAEINIGTRGLSLPRKECILDISEYRGLLPRDFYQLIGVKHGGAICQYSGRDFRLFSNSSAYLATPYSGLNTDSDSSFSYSLDRECYHNGWGWSPVKFNINSNYIDLTLKDGQVGFAYFSVPMDAEGRITVVRKHAEAISTYLKYKLLSTRYFANKLPEHIYKNAKLEWMEAKMRAKVVDDSPTLPELDYISSMMRNQTKYPNRNAI